MLLHRPAFRCGAKDSADMMPFHPEPQLIKLDKTCSALWLEGATPCQSLAKFLLEKEKQLDRWGLSSRETPLVPYGPTKSCFSAAPSGLALLGCWAAKAQLVPAVPSPWLCCVARGGGRKALKQRDQTGSQQLVSCYLCICVIRFYAIKLFHKVAVMKL